MLHIPETRLLAWLDGSLTQEERSNIAQHLHACPTCTSLLGEHRAIAKTASALPTIQVSRQFTQSLMTRIDPTEIGDSVFQLIFRNLFGRSHLAITMLLLAMAVITIFRLVSPTDRIHQTRIPIIVQDSESFLDRTFTPVSAWLNEVFQPVMHSDSTAILASVLFGFLVLMTADRFLQRFLHRARTAPH